MSFWLTDVWGTSPCLVLAGRVPGGGRHAAHGVPAEQPAAAGLSRAAAEQPGREPAKAFVNPLHHGCQLHAGVCLSAGLGALSVAQPAPTPPTPRHAPLPPSQVYAGCLPDKLSQLVRDTRLVVTVNSDDPAYFLAPPDIQQHFSSGVNSNFLFLATTAGLDEPMLARLAANSFRAAFLPPAAQAAHVAGVTAALAAWRGEQAGHAAAQAAQAALAT